MVFQFVRILHARIKNTMIQIDPKIFPKTAGAFLVGGSIRDMLCGLLPLDYDIAVLGDPAEYAHRIEVRTNGRLVEIGKPGQVIIRVVSDMAIIDITPAKEASIEKDLEARDFTVNAMAYDLAAQRLIDPMRARRDLKNRTIRMVSKDIFKKDPVRLLRAYRIATQLGFEIEAKTQAAIKENATRIRQSAGERVRDEFFKMLQCTKSHASICQMADNGLLFAILPELSNLKDCRPNRHHRFNALEHTLQAFFHLEKLLAATPKSATDANTSLAHRIAKTQFPLMKFCILMHDIGKPSTQTVDPDGTLHFYGHARRSAQMTNQICRRLRCSNHFTTVSHFLVRHHTRPRDLYTAQQEQNATSRAATRFFIKCGTYLPELLVIAAADTLGKASQHSRQHTAFIAFLVRLMLDFESEFRPQAAKPRLIAGHDLIADFGLKPSPLFKRILDRVEEERLSNSKMTRQEAVNLVRELIQNQGSTKKK
jgi:tRNA nucleotidyltransferase/poly(A) polymerase